MNFCATTKVKSFSFLTALLQVVCFLFLFSNPAHAVTEVTFTRVGPDAVQVESNGETKIFHDQPAEGSSANPTTVTVSPVPTVTETKPVQVVVPPHTPTRPATTGKVLSTPLVPVDGATEFPPMEGANATYNQTTPSNVLITKNGSGEVIQLPERDGNELTRLRKELQETKIELARVSRIIESPIILTMQGDSVQLQWADAKQQIAVPQDGVIKIQLAPK